MSLINNIAQEDREDNINLMKEVIKFRGKDVYSVLYDIYEKSLSEDKFLAIKNIKDILNPLINFTEAERANLKVKNLEEENAKLKKLLASQGIKV